MAPLRLWPGTQPSIRIPHPESRWSSSTSRCKKALNRQGLGKAQVAWSEPAGVGVSLK